MKYRKALIRPPGANYVKCLSCHPMRGTVDLKKAREQHAVYKAILADLGLEVIVLPQDDFHPDSCFVEDCAVVHGPKALITRMGAPSRRGEEDAVEAKLEDYLSTRRAEAPATVEGGDVVHLPDRLISGLSQRTNAEGIRLMGEWLAVKVDAIEDEEMMHLKSHVTYLGEGTLIATEKYSNHPALRGMDVIVVPKGEEYAADTLAIDDTVLMPAGRRESQRLVESAGFKVIPVDVSEFEKCDGALTCLSILF
ncbi:MAG: arginine deiminase-related protein [Thermoplasmata archaeon]|nr:arginine deiminase-related protein [Thermoplasmata archaeon]